MYKRVIVAAIIIALPVTFYLGWRNELIYFLASFKSSSAPKELTAADIGPIELSHGIVEIPETVTDKSGLPPLPPLTSAVRDFTADALWLRYEYIPRHNIASYDLMLVWHANNGDVERYNYANPKQVLRYSQDELPSEFAIPAGLILQGGKHYIDEKRHTDHARLVLLTRNSEVVVGRLNTARERPQFLLLNDGSLLVAGGITSRLNQDESTWTNTVEHVSYLDGKLVVEQMPDLPGETRHGVSLVQLADGTVLAAGGSTSRLIGVEPMVDTTYLLDIVKKTWRRGPPLSEPRTDGAGLLLPDGSVMLVGGWTLSHTWKVGASRTSDLLMPGSNTFVPGPLLPLGIASPTTTWINDRSNNKHLFVLGGITKAEETSHEVFEYDLHSREWRTVAEECAIVKAAVDPAYSPERPVFTFSASNGNNVYLWCDNYDRLGDTSGWNFLTPRLLNATEESPGRNIPKSGLALRREAVAFTPQQDDSPAIVAGGYVGSVATAAVDAISPNGQVEALANLNIARGDAQLFRLQDGSFIVNSGRRKRYGQDDDNAIRTMEWLPAGEPLAKAHWRLLDFALPPSAIIAPLNNGRLFTLEDGNIAKLITFSKSATGALEMKSSAMPSLTRKRERITYSESLKIKELRDGRIIVAGGAVQQHRIALLQEDSLDPQAIDNYEEIGSPVSARSYEIYNPRTGAWSESAPSRLESGDCAILDDGRVIKWGALSNEPSTKDNTLYEPAGYLEASSPDGSTWQEWPAKPLVGVERARLFIIEGELFISGTNPKMSSYSPRFVQWYDTSKKQWVTLWEDNGLTYQYKHVGRFIVRQLENGKRVVLPVQSVIWRP